MSPRLVIAIGSASLIVLSGAAALQPHAMHAKAPVEARRCAPCHMDDALDAGPEGIKEDAPENPFRMAFHRAMAIHAVNETGMQLALQQPEVVVLGSLTRFYGSVRFDHEIHADMSLMSGGCGNCHHDPSSEDGVRIAACRECHASQGHSATLEQPSLKGAFHRQCLGCHRDWTHENACGFCHQEADDLTAHTVATDSTDIVGTTHLSIKAQSIYSYDTSYTSAPTVTFHHLQHVTTFQLKCVDCHRSGSCDKCHDATVTRAPIEHAESCISCHARNNCQFCHTSSAHDTFDHEARTGWSLEPSHTRLACTDCHGDVTSFNRPSTNCRGCHTRLTPEDFDHTVTGVPLAGSHAHYECQRCHIGNSLTAPAVCTNCHADKSYPQHMPG